MEDGLETKAVSFLVNQLFILSTEKLEKQNKAESTVMCCILFMDGQKGGQDQPKFINKAFLGYRWHVLNLRCKWMPTN